jgi:hypothetical protein
MPGSCEGRDRKGQRLCPLMEETRVGYGRQSQAPDRTTSIQVNATRAGLGDQQQHKDLGTPGRFSRRLQLDPGLEPPTSWSLLPLYGPYNYLRAALAKSPGLEAIYLKVRGNAVDLVGNMLVREVRELTAAWLFARSTSASVRSALMSSAPARFDSTSSAFVRFVRQRRPRVSFAQESWAPVRSALLKSASVRLATRSLALFKSAPVRLGPLKSARLRSAPARFENERSPRLMPARVGRRPRIVRAALTSTLGPDGQEAPGGAPCGFSNLGGELRRQVSPPTRN